VIRPGGANVNASPDVRVRRRDAGRPPARDLKPYFVGGIVSAGVTALLIVVWLLAAPNNPLSGAPPGTPLPAINGINPLDLPTQVEQVGTPVPGELPTFVPPVPTGSAGPVGYLPRMDVYVPDALTP
jgi:hypothetical protein